MDTILETYKHADSTRDMIGIETDILTRYYNFWYTTLIAQQKFEQSNIYIQKHETPSKNHRGDQKSEALYVRVGVILLHKRHEETKYHKRRESVGTNSVLHSKVWKMWKARG